MNDFVHLHVHSHYSLLHALPQIPALVSHAKKQNMKALALTDYGSMYGAIEFYEECLKQEIKPLVGFEAYVVPGSRFEKNLKDDVVYHLVLLAENLEGYKNLMQLTSRGHLEGYYNVPRVDKELLRQYHHGVIALSGCLEGELPRHIKNGDSPETIKKVALEYQDIFGANNFYLELQDHPDRPGQVAVNNTLIQLSQDLTIPLVVTRDVHYLHPDDAEAQDVMTCIREGNTMNSTEHLSMRTVDRSFGTTKDIVSRFQHVPEALANTVAIADRCNLKIELNNWHFPPIGITPGKNADEDLHDQTYEKIAKLVPDVTLEMRKRIEYELEIIKNKCYSPYFLAVADYVGYARANGIIETTRGSAAGSLVAYALGITTVNPMFFKLPFERFLNPQRPSAPDVDADFADDKRDEMIAYVTEKYGADKVAQIITFGTMMARAAVRDVGRALGLAYGFCDQVAKLIPFGKQGFQMTIAQALKLEPDLKKLYENNPDVKRLLDIAQKVEGCARHTSIHAAGVVIADTTLTDFTPIQRETGGERITTQYDMHSVEAAGLLKMDFLGIRNLSILGRAVELVEERHGVHIDLQTLSFEDKKTYQMLARGETMGVFQLAGSGMTRYLKELRPTDIHDIMAMIALFRPGPMESIPEYIKRKHNQDLITYLDDRLKPILERTFGILVYQDDVMLIAIELAGYSWLEADKFRKAMGKKIPAEMVAQKTKFLIGCVDKGMPKVKAEYMWSLIEPFMGYGFNKAHASSYAVVAFQTAYLKANYPVEYMTAVLSAEAHHTDKIAAIVHECKRIGIAVLPPDVNVSGPDFTMGKDAEGKDCIRFGLNAIKNLGTHIATVIMEERTAGGAYSSLEDFLTRIHDKDLNKKSLESLIKCGAMDCFDFERLRLLSNSDTLLNFHREIQSATLSNQESLFAGAGFVSSGKIKLTGSVAASQDERVVWEKELLGFYLSSHPFERFVNVYGDVLTPLTEIEGMDRASWVVAGGLLADVKKKITKRGQIMLFITLEDISGPVEMLVFPKVYEQTTELWKEGTPIAIIGKVPEEEGDNKIFVEKAFALQLEDPDSMRAQLGITSFAPRPSALARGNGAPAPASQPQQQAGSKRLIISCTPDLPIDGNALRELIKKYPGKYQVVFASKDNGKKLVTPHYVQPHGELLENLETLFGKESITVEG